MSGQRWDKDSRAEFLLRPDIEWPLSLTGASYFSHLCSVSVRRQTGGHGDGRRWGSLRPGTFDAARRLLHAS